MPTPNNRTKKKTAAHKPLTVVRAVAHDTAGLQKTGAHSLPPANVTPLPSRTNVHRTSTPAKALPVTAPPRAGSCGAHPARTAHPSKGLRIMYIMSNHKESFQKA